MNAKIIIGDALAVLRTLESESVQCVVTSPPYWGLRDYGTASWEGGEAGCEHKGDQRWYTESTAAISSAGAFSEAGEANAERLKKGRWREAGTCECGAIRRDQQLGLERTPAEYISKMVEVFAEVRRVLRSDGTCWVNMGDSYAGYWGEKYAHRPFGADRTADETTPPNKQSPNFKTCGFKPKDLMGVPWMLAFALRSDGWYLRSDIIWAKKNPMPESVTDRPSKSHEYLFLLTKSERYYYDAFAIREKATSNDNEDLQYVQDAPPDNLFLQEQSTERRTFGKVRGLHEDVAQNIRSQVQPDCESEGQRASLPLLNQGPGDENLIPQEICESPGGQGKTAGVVEGLRKATQVQGQTPEIRSVTKGQGNEGEERRQILQNSERPSSKAQSGNQTKAPSQDGGMHADASAVESNQGRARESVRVLPQGEGVGNGSCDPPIERRCAHGAEHSSSLPTVQCTQGGSRGRGGKTAFRGQGANREIPTGPANRDGREMRDVGVGQFRNKRSVWHISTQAFPLAHFATFPEELITPCILAGTSEKGCCAACGAPWERVTEDGEPIQQHWAPGTQEKVNISQGKHGSTSVMNTGFVTPRITVDWEPSCKCSPACSPAPCTVLDPFAGSGTTGVVALRYHRSFVGIELNTEYAAMSERRISGDAPLFNKIEETACTHSPELTKSSKPLASGSAGPLSTTP